MKKINQLGKVLSKSEMKKIIGGGDSLKPYYRKMWDSTSGTYISGGNTCEEIAFIMNNHSYLLNPDGTDPWRKEWEKKNCDDSGIH